MDFRFYSKFSIFFWPINKYKIWTLFFSIHRKYEPDPLEKTSIEELEQCEKHLLDTLERVQQTKVRFSPILRSSTFARLVISIIHPAGSTASSSIIISQEIRKNHSVNVRRKSLGEKNKNNCLSNKIHITHQKQREWWYIPIYIYI